MSTIYIFYSWALFVIFLRNSALGVAFKSYHDQRTEREGLDLFYHIADVKSKYYVR